jgi:hypothetical protein
MSDSEDLYLAERARASRRLADAAKDPAARQAHLALATHYEERRAAARKDEGAQLGGAAGGID